jgi:hypothetical protein
LFRVAIWLCTAAVRAWSIWDWWEAMAEVMTLVTSVLTVESRECTLERE